MPSRAQHGFTLLELLVAFVILSVAVGTLLHTFGQSLRNTALAEEYTLATLHAQSVLAGVGVEPPLTEGRYRGDLEEGFEWWVEISEYIDPEAPVGVESVGFAVTLYRVEVAVHWPSGRDTRQVTLETLRLSWDEP